MSFSTDDRFLLTVSDCVNSSNLIIWKTIDYTELMRVDSIDVSYAIYDVAWNPLRCNELSVCGRSKLLAVCRLEEKPFGKSALNFSELEVPMVIREQQGDKFDFVSLTYGEDYLLFAATNHGLVTVWNVKTNNCFLNWQADLNEINVLISTKHKLITGSNKGCLKLWNISAIHKMKQSNENKFKLDGLIIDSEIQLNSAVKCCQFDPTLDIGIVATSKNTLWYVNWQEENSVRLVSTHTGRINNVCCIEDRFLATVSEDGSLNIWSLSDRERIVQFEVKTPALCQALVYCDDKLFQSISKYAISRKTSKNNPLVIVGYEDGSIRLYDIDKKNIIYKMKPINSAVTAINHCRNCKFQFLFTSLKMLFF